MSKQPHLTVADFHVPVECAESAEITWCTGAPSTYLSFWSNEFCKGAWEAYDDLNRTVRCYGCDRILGRSKRLTKALCPECMERYHGYDPEIIRLVDWTSESE